MRLEKIAEDNLSVAIDTAYKIFPYENHENGFWPEIAYKMSIKENKENFAYYLAYDVKTIVGITGYYPPENYIQERGKDGIWLGWFGVVPEQRNKGYGKQILIETTKIISNLGQNMLHLYSGDRCEEELAHHLYLKMGFEQYDKGDVDGFPVLYFRSSIPLK